jgi:hypothetical protein
LARIQHNYERSIDLSNKLREAGILETEDNIHKLICLLLEAGTKATTENDVVAFYVVGSCGRVKIESVWSFYPDIGVMLETAEVTYFTTAYIKPNN